MVSTIAAPGVAAATALAANLTAAVTNSTALGPGAGWLSAALGVDVENVTDAIVVTVQVRDKELG